MIQPQTGQPKRRDVMSLYEEGWLRCYLVFLFVAADFFHGCRETENVVINPLL